MQPNPGGKISFNLLVIIATVVYLYVANHNGSWPFNSLHTTLNTTAPLTAPHPGAAAEVTTTPAADGKITLSSPINLPAKVPDIVYEGHDTDLPKVMIVRPGAYVTCYENGRTVSYWSTSSVYMKRTYYINGGEKKTDETLLANETDAPMEKGVTITRSWKSASPYPCYVVADKRPVDGKRALELISNDEQKNK